MATMSTCGSDALALGFGEIGRGFGASPAGQAIFNPLYDPESISIRGDCARTWISSAPWQPSSLSASSSFFSAVSLRFGPA
jgi:hypothetical protein